MAHLAGWYGTVSNGDNALTRMVAALNAMSPVTEDAVGDTFALATKQPALAGDISRIATSDDGKVAVAFAGYLHETDVDIATNPARHCLELYEKSGTQFALELNGSWTAVVADERKGQLHLVSDRLASRPLFYAEGGPFLFSTRMQAILDFPGFSADVSANQLVEYLAMGVVAGCATLCDRIRQVPSGTVLTWDGRSCRMQHYWSPASAWDDDTSADECADRIAHAMRSAMQRICARTDSCAIMLSGGMDSRAVAAASSVPLHCVTMHTSDRAQEVVTARRVARTLDYPHQFVPLPHDHPLGLLQLSGRLTDGMRAFHHFQALHLADAVTQLRPQVILGGWLLDSYFAGRIHPLAPARGLAQFTPRRLLPASQLGSGADHWLSLYPVAPREVLERLCVSDMAQTSDRVRSHLSAQEARLREGMHSVHARAMTLLIPSSGDLNVPAADHLSAADTPAYDSEVLDAYLATPPALCLRHIAYGRALAHLNRDVARIPLTGTGVPVTWGPALEHWGGLAVRYWRGGMRRVRRLRGGDMDLERAWPNVAEAMAGRPEWREELRARVGSSRMVDMGIIHRDALGDIVEDHIARRANHKGILGTWLTLEVWLGQYQGAESP